MDGIPMITSSPLKGSLMAKSNTVKVCTFVMMVLTVKDIIMLSFAAMVMRKKHGMIKNLTYAALLPNLLLSDYLKKKY